jgi:hypothetical protein
VLPEVIAAEEACVGGRVEVAGRFQGDLPGVGISRYFSLPRAVGTVALDGPFGGAVASVGAVRSGGEDGYIGVSGEAIVTELRVAAARVRVAEWGLGLSGGLLPDPWVASGDAASGLRLEAPGLGEEQGWFSPGDLGLSADWTAPGGWGGLSVGASSGEGLRRRERNEGQDLSLLLSVHPLAGLDAPDALGVGLFARDGSSGLDLVRDHRLGLRVDGGADVVGGGVELLMALGVDGDGERSPRALSAWLRGGADERLFGWGRLDLVTEVPGDPLSRTALPRVGLGWDRLPGPERLALAGGWTARWAGTGVTELAGAEAETATNTLFIQVEAGLGAGRPLSPGD